MDEKKQIYLFTGQWLILQPTARGKIHTKKWPDSVIKLHADPEGIAG